METVLYPPYQSKVVFGADGPQPQILTENEKYKVIVAGLKPGQRIPSHREAMAVYHILEGTGQFTVNENLYSVSPGAMVIVPADASRGLEAETQLVFMATRIA